ncbi:hypothetical protein F5B22DRAFT_631943 [Xylaria bambusicola]|uniref:uncharacterized protein n=1 Tax=Xylaria bambusicola TaxID=326684 RepID=UPI002007DFCF|nr:uncharacterized protein F5B22DRAFT_631943 [Xylaria bambusicola]KAI0502824.1 hypothetical protein F5B22DRAFT_631943 [Xylaria bambusicola]
MSIITPEPEIPRSEPGENSYDKLEEEPSVFFIYCPDPSQLPLTQEWTALVKVKCNNVPLLMTRGFHWDHTNIIREEGFFDHDFTEYQRGDDKKWAVKRNYFLESRLEDRQEALHWYAAIEVVALRTQVASRFDLSQLSQPTIRVAWAMNRAGKLIYYWHFGRNDMCVNAIYDQMVLEGGWPWPKTACPEPAPKKLEDKSWRSRNCSAKC